MAELTEELRVLVTAEVDRAIKQLGSLDKKTKSTESEFKKLGQVIGSAFATKEIIAFSQTAIKAWENSQRTVRTLGAVLKSTGAEAWTSSEELQKMASSLQDLTGYANDSIISMQSVLLGFKNINGDNFKEATKAILDMSAVMGMDLKSAAQSIGKALDDPINGMDSLREQGFKFTDAQKKVMQSMIDTGNIAGAQKIILDELNGTFGGAAEASALYSTQLKNSFGDLQEAIGSLPERINNILGYFGAKGILSTAFTDTKKAIEWLSDAFNSFDQNVARVAGGETYKRFYDSLSDEAKLKEAKLNLSQITKEYDKALESGKSKKIDTAIIQLDFWRKEVKIIENRIAQEKELQKQANERAESEAKIENLITSIDKKYEALGKQDPSIQLELYQKKFLEIEEQRKQLSLGNNTDIDTSGALKQLDKLESDVQRKIKEIAINGKKTWQSVLAETLNVDINTFSTGKEAAEKYIKGLESALSTSSDISEALGETFNVSEVLESQMEEVRKVIQQLLTIPADKIDDPFKIYNGSIEDLIAKYGELENARNRALVDKEIAELQVKVDSLNKSEWDLIETRLKDVDATEDQIKKYKELFDLLHAEDEDIPTWQDKVKKKMTGLIEDLDMFDAKTQIVLANMATAFATAMPETTLSGFRSFGEALGEGADASEALGAALADMAEQILNQLPMMFLQAGLQLIAQGQWPLGLGFIAAAGSTSVMAGYVQSKKSSSTKENAFGGVYGDDSYSAFAKGGYFTNQIVDSPTYFRFAKGSGFGTGLMGEAGPEAIMPLTRGSDGSLGVRAEGVGSNVAIALNVRINNYSNEKVDVQESTDESGQKQLEVTIGAMFNQHITSGKADKAFKSRYGLEAQGY